MSVEIGSTNEGRWELYHALNLRNKLRSRQAYLMALFQKACLFQKSSLCSKNGLTRPALLCLHRRVERFQPLIIGQVPHTSPQ